MVLNNKSVIGTYFFHNTVCIFTRFKIPNSFLFICRWRPRKWSINQKCQIQNLREKKIKRKKNTPKIKSLLNIND